MGTFRISGALYLTTGPDRLATRPAGPDRRV